MLAHLKMYSVLPVLQSLCMLVSFQVDMQCDVQKTYSEQWRGLSIKLYLFSLTSWTLLLTIETFRLWYTLYAQCLFKLTCKAIFGKHIQSNGVAFQSHQVCFLWLATHMILLSKHSGNVERTKCCFQHYHTTRYPMSWLIWNTTFLKAWHLIHCNE